MPPSKRKLDPTTAAKKVDEAKESLTLENEFEDLKFDDEALRDESSDELTIESDDDDDDTQPEPVFDCEDGENDSEDFPGPIFDTDEDSQGESSDDNEEEDNDGNEEPNYVSVQERVAESTSQQVSVVKNASSAAEEAGPSNESKQDEYHEDSSDEEDIRNTVGNIPMNWYDDYPHLGYDWTGNKILKPETGDQLDEFLKRMEDPDYWRTVTDKMTGQKVVLSDEDVQLISRIQGGQVPDADFKEYAPWIEWFTSQKMTMPVRKFPEHKRSFLPSVHEKEKVSKLVHALKMGWILPDAEKRKARAESKKPKVYMLWKSEDPEEMRRIHNHIPAPKRPLPGNAESYNPPPEYLFDKKELKEWKKQEETPWKRKLHFLPQKYGSLRQVPAYPKFVQERFQRCLDLYLCPRGRKMRLSIEPEDLVPKLPSPKDLQPFPTMQSIVYSGHTDIIRSISVDSKGQYLISGSDDMTVKVWEISSGRCVRTVQCGGIVRSVAWCPSQSLSLILVAADKKVLLINPGVGDTLVVSKTDAILEEEPPKEKVPDRVSAAVQWEHVDSTSQSYQSGIRIIINHFKEIKQVSWHGRGDYFSSVMPDGLHRSVMIHQLSRRRSQVPFSKSKGLVQKVLFHPIRPLLFVALQRNIRVYDLLKQEMVKKLKSGARWISAMAVHSGGDNILVGTYDRKLLWFDLDLSTTPYRTLRLHSAAIRGVAYHSRYPLFASASDDKSVIVSHGMVYSDLLQNPLIVPLKRLTYHSTVNDIGVCDVIFHPIQPWLFSSGADNTIRLYT